MKDLLLAIDQGTSGCKITIFDTAGQVVSSVTKSYPTYYPEEGFVEQKPEEWWQVIKEGIQSMLEEDAICPTAIKGIGIDGTSWACIPVNQSGDVLYPAMIWLDRRAGKQADWMKEKLNEEALIALSGNPVDPAYITPKMLWLKENRPDLYQQTDKFLQSNAYIAFKLTGKYSQDYSQCYGFHFFNMKTGQWDETVADALGISLDLMAPIMQSHDVVGHVTEEVAKATGLSVGTPVVAGGLDAACCTLGAGVIHEGQTQEQGGQAGGMSIALSQPVIHPKLILGYHVIPNMWLLQGGTTGGGGTLNWFNREFGHAEQQEALEKDSNPFAVMSEEASAIPPGSDGILFLPYMKGERSPLWNSQAKGVYYGLSFDKTRAHMIRSTMEGVAYALRHNLETAEETGIQVGKLSSVGGSANSHVWTQLKADITSRTIEVPYSDHATTLGAAILAGVGVGLYKDFEDAVKQTVSIQRTHEPHQERVETYNTCYHNYLELSHLFVRSLWS
ncbi:FGGY-family carbohydrate kinase [Vallitalea pronyensis]|uniref:FGGY-family carbohydrate kinase n=1 Tax=Vallitalea pronyensis TaxID=1348613 RepID=A0A8J8SIZ1_9FIRM|nr:FGGY-family carbohydrate kinase [Vallitalea pronyensis]QUI24944.1 FGGY-family carbohydrate kinase [Vallitalea pronyensis]